MATSGSPRPSQTKLGASPHNALRSGARSWKPSDQRAAVQFLAERGVSERRACQLLAANRSSVQYRPWRDADEALVERFACLAQRHPRCGYRRIWALLSREAWVVNHKRVQRLWQQARLQVRKARRRRRRTAHPDQIPTQATYPGHVWTYDFVQDACWNGAKLRVLPVVDEFTRECLAIEVATSLPAARVIAVLAYLFTLHGAPTYPIPRAYAHSAALVVLARVQYQSHRTVEGGECPDELPRLQMSCRKDYDSAAR